MLKGVMALDGLAMEYLWELSSGFNLPKPEVMSDRQLRLVI
jgi:hypothetical protein